MVRTLLLLYSYNNSVSRHWDYCCLTHDWPYYLIFRHSGSGCTMKRTLCCYLVTTLLLYNYSIPRSDVRTIVEQPMTDFIAWFLVNRSLAAQCTLVETLLWNKSIRLHDVRIVVLRPPKSESKRSQTVKRKEHSKSFAQKIVSTFSRPRGRKEEKEESEKFFVVWQSGKMLTTTKTGLSDNKQHGGDRKWQNFGKINRIWIPLSKLWSGTYLES